MRRKEIFNDLLLIIVGNAILSIGVGLFVLPSNILSGGVAGISVALQPFLHISPNAMINILTVGLFLVGSLLLGKKFAINTLLSTIFYPLLVTMISARVDLCGCLCRDWRRSCISFWCQYGRYGYSPADY